MEDEGAVARGRYEVNEQVEETQFSLSHPLYSTPCKVQERPVPRSMDVAPTEAGRLLKFRDEWPKVRV